MPFMCVKACMWAKSGTSSPFISKNHMMLSSHTQICVIWMLGFALKIRLTHSGYRSCSLGLCNQALADIELIKINIRVTILTFKKFTIASHVFISRALFKAQSNPIFIQISWMHTSLGDSLYLVVSASIAHFIPR